MLTSNDLCRVCSDLSREDGSICVVESPSDVLAIESTGGYKGKYFVLLGRLSQIEGIGPEDLGIDDLINLIKEEDIKELIFECLKIYLIEYLELSKLMLSSMKKWSVISQQRSKPA